MFVIVVVVVETRKQKKKQIMTRFVGAFRNFSNNVIAQILTNGQRRKHKTTTKMRALCDKKPKRENNVEK